MSKRPIYAAGPSAAPFAVTINTQHDLSHYYYVGVGGDVSIVTPGGVTVIYKGVPTGGYVWAASVKVNTSGTTATDIVGHP